MHPPQKIPKAFKYKCRSCCTLEQCANSFFTNAPFDASLRYWCAGFITISIVDENKAIK